VLPALLLVDLYRARAAYDERSLSTAGRLVRWVQDRSADPRGGMHATSVDDIDTQRDQTREMRRMLSTFAPQE